MAFIVLGDSVWHDLIKMNLNLNIVSPIAATIISQGEINSKNKILYVLFGGLFDGREYPLATG